MFSKAIEMWAGQQWLLKQRSDSIILLGTLNKETGRWFLQCVSSSFSKIGVSLAVFHIGYTAPRSMLNSHRLTRDGTVAFFAAFKSMGAMLSGPVDFLTFSCFNFSRPELCAILNSFSCGDWRCCISGRNSSSTDLVGQRALFKPSSNSATLALMRIFQIAQLSSQNRRKYTYWPSRIFLERCFISTVKWAL